MIIERTKVLEAYTRVVVELGATHDDACASVAQSLATGDQDFRKYAMKSALPDEGDSAA